MKLSPEKNKTAIVEVHFPRGGDGAFVSRKTCTVNGYELLQKSGYKIADIKTGLFW